MQETVIGVARKMPSFSYDPTRCSFKGWLVHVARRRIIDLRRRQQSGPARFRPFCRTRPRPRLSQKCAMLRLKGLSPRCGTRNGIRIHPGPPASFL